MSALSISNHLIMRMLQRQNTKRVIAKRMRVAESGEHNVLDIIVDGGSVKEEKVVKDKDKDMEKEGINFTGADNTKDISVTVNL